MQICPGFGRSFFHFLINQFLVRETEAQKIAFRLCLKFPAYMSGGIAVGVHCQIFDLELNLWIGGREPVEITHSSLGRSSLRDNGSVEFKVQLIWLQLMQLIGSVKYLTRVEFKGI